jgi:hypothetical protein
VPEGGPPASSAAPDWRAVARTLEEAQLAWRKLGPVEHTVPRKALTGERAVTARYAAATQALAAPLAGAFREATRQREELTAAAKNLVSADGVARGAVDKVRNLQAQWQAHAKALPLPRREENALWSAFKSATDAVFTALSATRAAKEAEFSARTKEREEIIERVAALASSTAAQDIRRALAEADTAWRASAEVPKPLGVKLDARYRAARDAANRRLGEVVAHASQSRFDALIAAMALCHQRETAGEVTAELETRWSAVENLPAAWKPKLEARFRGIGAGPAAPPASSSASRSKVAPGETLPDLLLKLEAACNIDSPGEFLADRQRLKLLALKNAMEARRTEVTKPEDIERWLIDAAAMPTPDDGSRERLARIVAAARRRARS